MTGADLERLTHTEPPWMIANERRRLSSDQRIQTTEITNYFKMCTAAERFDDDFDDPSDDYSPPVEFIHEWLADAPARFEKPARVDDLAALDRLAGR
jgi:hypothetical protein